jgi:hypothetical protein
LRSVTIEPSSNAALDSVKVAMRRAKKLKGPIFKAPGLAASSSRWGELRSAPITRKGETEAERVACLPSFADRARLPF